MLVTEPQAEVFVEAYQREFAPSDVSSKFSDKQTIGEVVAFYWNQMGFGRVTHANSNPDQLPELEGFFDTALQNAKEAKVARDNARRSSMRSFIDKANTTLFRRTEEPPGHPEPPQSPPPPQEG